MKIAFDEEVISEDIEAFRKLLHKVRNPHTIYNTFAFTGYHAHASTQMQGRAIDGKKASLR